MDLRDLFKGTIFGVLIEGIGFIFAVIAIGHFILGGTLGELAKIFIGTL